jgi:hypothetical protein
MSIQRLPRVVFNLELLPARGARKELTTRLEQHLSKHLGPVRAIGRWIFPVSLLKVTLAAGFFSVGIARRRRKGPNYGAWSISIDPVIGRVPGNTSIEEQSRYAKDLKLISDEIHTLLANIPEVTRLRWFFEGWDNKTPGVRSPADLP